MSQWHQLASDTLPGQIARSYEVKNSKPPAIVQQKRSFASAKIDRLTADWLTTNNAIDQELRSDLDRLRMRSRQLGKDNDYARKFLNMVVRNVVGHSGFTLQARAEDAPNTPDNLARAAVETHFARWARLGVCDVTGRMSFADIQRLVMRMVARDGEALVLELYGKAAGNKYGYALQVLDVARLDTTMNLAATNGRNSIVMGVEMNSYQRPVAYWLYEKNPGSPEGGGQRIRIEANNVMHFYLPDHAEQSRGIPWLHTAMIRLHNLRGYEEAAVIAARIGASKMGFFTSPDGSAADIATDSQDGEFMTEATPGEFGVIPAGWSFESFNPDYPHQQYGEFIKAALRGISSGLDVSYNSLANDLEGVNYSSIRSGVLEERDQWMTLQGWFVEAFLTRVFEGWLEMGLLNGAITQSNGSALPLAKLDKFLAHRWQGRRWQWVDPMKDIEAARLAVRSGVSSPQAIAAQTGVDFEDMLADIAAFEKAVADAGVTSISYAESGVVNQTSASPTPPDTGSGG